MPNNHEMHANPAQDSKKKRMAWGIRREGPCPMSSSRLDSHRRRSPSAAVDLGLGDDVREGADGSPTTRNWRRAGIGRG